MLKQKIFGTNTKTKNFGTGIILQMKTLPPTASSLHSGDGITTAYIQREERENASCWIHLLHELLQILQRIVILETKLLAGLPKQTEHSADHRHGPSQHTAGESHESSESQQFIPSVEEQAKTDRHTNRWHKQGARPKGTQDIRLSRVSRIAAVASSTPDSTITRLVNTGILPPPIHLENRFEALMNAGEESPNVIKHVSDQPAANTATNRRSRSSRQRHSAQSAAEPRTLIVGDSIIRNISSRTTTTCCLPQATVSDVNKELQNILMKHKTANRIIIHVGKNDIRKEQSELLKKDFSELFETL